jgi:hypothetical protein
MASRRDSTPTAATAQTKIGTMIAIVVGVVHIGAGRPAHIIRTTNATPAWAVT